MRTALAQYTPPAARIVKDWTPSQRVRVAVNGSRGQIGAAVRAAAHECPFYRKHVRVAVANDLSNKGRREKSNTTHFSQHPAFPSGFLDEHRIDTVIEVTRDSNTGRPSENALRSDLSDPSRTVVYGASHPRADAGVIWGVNEDLVDFSRSRFLSAETCTANCVAPVLAALSPFGLKSASLTLHHAYDPSHWRRDLPGPKFVSQLLLDFVEGLAGRGPLSIHLPMQTTVGHVVEHYFPGMSGKVNASCTYVPAVRGIEVQMRLRIKKRVREHDLLERLRQAESERFAGVIGLSERPLYVESMHPWTTSNRTEYVPYSSVVSLPSLDVENGGRTIRLRLFQDNIMGYAARLVDIAILAAFRRSAER